MPGRPWQKVAVDLCVLKGGHFLVVVDYFSRFIEIAYQNILESTTYIYSGKKKHIGEMGIPEELLADIGTQFKSYSFKNLAFNIEFSHTTASLHYP